MEKKEKFLNLIKSNINEFGFHVTIVNDNIHPRYAYTIGLYEKIGYELIFAGGVRYLKKDILNVFKYSVEKLKLSNNIATEFSLGDLGSFSLQNVDSSWSSQMLLGVFDFYNLKKVKSLQIVPEIAYHTLDTPNMDIVWNMESEPIWKWLKKKWNLQIPKNSSVVTNLNALKGEAITEVLRWEIDEWEMFSGYGPDVKKEDTRIVSFATIIGIDESLQSAINLEVGKGIYRDENKLKWQKWN